MNRYLKYGLWAIGSVIALVAVAVAYIALTFDPNDYKPRIVQAVKDGKQRTLRLDGDIRLHFFPNISLGIGHVSLSEFRSEQEFASLEKAIVSLKLLPLLTGSIVVDEVAISGLKANLVRNKDGSNNFDDLLANEADAPAQPAQQAASPMRFDVAAVSLEQVQLSWRDLKTAASYTISEMSLKTGRIANAVPTTIDLSLHATANRPKADIVARLKTGLTFDLASQHFRLHGMELQANGSALEYSGIALSAGGDADLHLPAKEYKASRLTLAGSASKGKERYGIKLDVPDLSLGKDRVSGKDVTLAATLDGAFGNLVASVSVPAMEGNARSFKTESLGLDVELKQPAQIIKARLDTQLTGSIEAQQFNFSSLSLALNAAGDNLPGKRIASELKGSIQADLGRQYIETTLAGGLLQSQVKARASVRNFKVPLIRYDLEIDQFDADPYMPQKTAEAQGGKTKQEVEQPFDLSALRDLNLEGSLRVGALKAANIKVAQLRVDVKGRDGIVNVAPLTARLYKGNLDGKVTVNAHTSAFTLNQKLSGVDVAPLLKDAADLDIVEGRGSIALDIATRGNTVSGLKKALNGNAKVELGNGAIKGIDLAKLVQGLQNLSKETTTRTLGVDQNEKTEFSEFKASFRIRNGVAHNDDLAVKSTVLRLAGSGDIDIGNDRMDYEAKAIFAKTEQGRTGTLPVKVSGPFDDLKFKIDYAALLKDVAKQKLDEKKEQLKEDAKAKAREELKKGLKGLFK